MESSSISSLLTPIPRLPARLPRRRPRLRPFKLRASSEDVDENMSMLRKRISEIRALDRAEDTVGARLRGFSEIEKEYCCKLYDSEMLELLGLLQVHLAESLPRAEVGLTVVVRLSVPVAVLVVMLHLVDAAKGVLGVMQQQADN